jgi:hypothetical protein
MRNAGSSEVRCQNEVSESKAPAASNVTSKVTRSRRVTDSLQADGVPFGGYKIDNRAGRAYRGQTHKYFKVDAGDCRLLVMASVSSTTATFLECGGKRSATPLFFAQLRG